MERLICVLAPRIWFRLLSTICALGLSAAYANANANDESSSANAYEQHDFYGSGGGPNISVAPIWESYKPESKPWTEFSARVIDELGEDMLAGARDMKIFCPHYSRLKHDDKVTVWLYIVSALVKYESYFNATDRYEETGMGKDPITHRTIWSEGLLQLSYQDILKYPFCNEFNWHHDKNLPGNDPRKTILNPFKNLKCGIQILNDQIRRHQNIAVDDGAYWAVIMPRNVHNRLDKIKALVNGISICQN